MSSGLISILFYHLPRREIFVIPRVRGHTCLTVLDTLLIYIFMIPLGLYIGDILLQYFLLPLNLFLIFHCPTSMLSYDGSYANN